MSNTLIMVFTRNPELGKVKTRLAKTIGDEAALGIYKELLNHTENVMRQVSTDKAVYYSVNINNDDIWDNSIYQKYKQEGEDLGLRMLHAFAKSFNANYENVIIVASDLYDISSSHIEDAIAQLNTNNVVIGPSFDGGYYLLGMNRLYSEVFLNKEWGTETVLEDTLLDLKDTNVHLLEPLNDIDTFDDIKHIPELIDLISING